MQQDRNYLSVWLEERKNEYVLRIPKSLPANALRHKVRLHGESSLYAVVVPKNPLMRLSVTGVNKLSQIHPITIRVTNEEV